MGSEIHSYQRPPEIGICYEAARKGNVAEVKKQVRHLLHEPQPTGAAAPDPAWLYGSLDIAIRNENLEIVQFLLSKDVARGDLPVEPAVRQRAKDVMELFLQYGWDINKPLRRNEMLSFHGMSNCPWPAGILSEYSVVGVRSVTANASNRKASDKKVV